jgi:hypothetical protein
MVENTRNTESEKKHLSQTKDKAKVVYSEIKKKFKETAEALEDQVSYTDIGAEFRQLAKALEKCESSQDIWNKFKALVKAIKNHKVNHSVIKAKNSNELNRMFAIYGGWGSGKTTLLEQIEVLASDSFEIVWFRPWEYYDEAKDINKKLLSKIIPQNIPWWSWFLIVVLIFILLSIIVFLPVLSSIWISFINLDQVIKLLIVLSIAIIVTLAIFFISKNKWMKYIPNIIFKGVSLKEVIDIYGQIQDYTVPSQDISESITKAVGGDRKILVFIDDLDRCQKETVIKVLEDVKHFYKTQQLYFIFALDRKTLASYISEYYQYQDDKGVLDTDRGYQYLDKLFPDSYSLRYLDGRDIFKKYLKDYGILENLTEENIELYYLFIEYYAYFNWRKVESLITKFAQIYQKIGYSKVVESDDGGLFIHLDQIFRWCLVHEFYSEIFEERNWRMAILTKFLTKGDIPHPDPDKEYNLFRNTALEDSNRHQYILAIDNTALCFHLEKLYNSSQDIISNNNSVSCRLLRPDHNNQYWKVIVVRDNKTLFDRYATNIPWKGSEPTDMHEIKAIERKVDRLLKSCVGVVLGAGKIPIESGLWERRSGKVKIYKLLP